MLWIMKNYISYMEKQFNAVSLFFIGENMNQQNYLVLSKILIAVETGGQVYGKGRYDDYTPPYKNTSQEHTITLGAPAFYGSEARELVQMIYNKNPEAFKKLDTASPSIYSMLGKDWVGIRWNPNSSQKQALIKIIDSPVGHDCQNELFTKQLKKYVERCESTYTKNTAACMMYAEIDHLGGKSAVDRIFKRCNGNYSLKQIMSALKQDQYDTSSSNQVGDKKFQSRHDKCVEFINKYAVKEDGGEVQMTPLQRAKKLLRQPQGSTMTGYTPDGKSYFVSAGAWYKEPKKGDVIYFYSTSKGRVGHTGIVEKVDTKNKIVHTIEGNTSSTEYAENGGCVARHQYSYKSQGGTNRVNGFGRPDFAGAGITADDFVNVAIGELGYLEKRNNSQLDSKTANAGSNNYQKYQRDVGAGNGDQWCQYFVDCCALYTCQGNHIDIPETKLNETVKWTGYVTEDLNVRKWAGTEYDLCSFSPLSTGVAVGVCDELKASNGNTWYYIDYNGKHGFVSAKYISKTKPEEKKEEPKKEEQKETEKTTDKVILKKGDQGSKVKTMQKLLNRLGYSLTVDGDFGDATFAALKKYQKSAGLKADGVYYESTKKKLEEQTKVKSAKDITVDQFLKSAKNVMDTARTKRWHYGDSHSIPPCKDKTISCDRLIARALWDLGFTDQRQGGETCGTLDEYLKEHGFYRSKNKSDIRKGSILLVKHAGYSYISHAFICVKFSSNWVTDRYDAGSDARIQTAQPLRDVSWGYRTDDVIVYNISKKKDKWEPTGTATATVNDLNVRKGPDTQYDIIRTLGKGNRFEVDGNIDGNWVHCKVQNDIGWVSKKYIKYD